MDRGPPDDRIIMESIVSNSGRNNGALADDDSDGANDTETIGMSTKAKEYRRRNSILQESGRTSRSSRRVSMSISTSMRARRQKPQQQGAKDPAEQRDIVAEFLEDEEMDPPAEPTETERPKPKKDVDIDEDDDISDIEGGPEQNIRGERSVRQRNDKGKQVKHEPLDV